MVWVIVEQHEECVVMCEELFEIPELSLAVVYMSKYT